MINVVNSFVHTDIEHLKKEGLVLLLLRLIKLFDAGFFEGARKLSMRIIAAWNHDYDERKLQSELPSPEIKDQHKKCLILICHIYLMAIYEMDDNRGFVIDNLVSIAVPKSGLKTFNKPVFHIFLR